jgi:3-phenylpropionate/trans-cinnamate dioxygenase ferredoxin subunit
MTEHWHDVGAEDAVVEDEALGVKIGDIEIGVYRINGTLYAIEDVCPHAYALLSQGFIDGEEIECPLHEAVFHIPSGRCLKEPADRDLKTYEVKTENGRVLVRVSATD